jgi:hypothetical protein
MIKKFDTSFTSVPPVIPTDGGTPPPSGVEGGKGKSNTLLYVILGGVVLYLGYKFIVKPMLDKRKVEQEQPEN